MNGLPASGLEQLVPAHPLFQGVLAAAVGDGTPLWSGDTLLRSFLIGWLFWLGISLGSQALVWLHELTGGAWGRAIRADVEAAGQTLPLLLLGLIPILLGLPVLYAWARPEAMAHDPILARKALWLNPTGFIVRSLFYGISWIVMSAWIRAVRRRAQREPTEENERIVRARSAQGLLLYGLTMTFAAIDWGMSLEPHWYSGIYGVIFIIGQALAGLAFAVLMGTFGPSRPPVDRPLWPKRDLGNLLLAFTMLWTYVSFSQFLIIWFGDLPEEVVYYTRRNALGWEWLALLLVSLHFAVPFLLLLSGDVKSRARLLGMIAFGLLVMRWFDVVWHVEPAFGPSRPEYLLLHAAIALAIGVIWWPVFLWRRSAVKRIWPVEPMAAVEVHHG